MLESIAVHGSKNTSIDNHGSKNTGRNLPRSTFFYEVSCKYFGPSAHKIVRCVM